MTKNISIIGTIKNVASGKNHFVIVSTSDMFRNTVANLLFYIVDKLLLDKVL